MWTLRRLLASRLVVWGLVLAGVLERAAWNLLRPGGWGGSGEAMNVAIAVAEGRGFADAYRFGQGPTGHVLPISPGIGGIVYHLLGVRSPAAEIVLGAWSIGLAMGAYLLLYAAFRHMGVPRWVRLIGLAFGAVAPPYLSQEAVDFRVWEGGLAAFLAALFLERLLVADTRLPPRSPPIGRAAVVLGLVAALLFFVNPPLGAAAAACLVLFGLRRLSVGQNAAAAACSFAAVAAMVAPWALRNERALGAPVLLRSNAGLELALTNYPGAASTDDERREFLARMDAIHPTMTDASYNRMMAMGEVAYADALGRGAVAWMRANPGDATRLALRHVRESLVPSTWKFDAWGDSPIGRAKAKFAQFVGVLGLIGMATLLLGRRPGVIYPVLLVVVTAVVFSPFQPVVRYTYLIYPIMVYFMASAALLPGLARQRARADRPSAPR